MDNPQQWPTNIPSFRPPPSLSNNTVSIYVGGDDVLQDQIDYVKEVILAINEEYNKRITDDLNAIAKEHEEADNKKRKSYETHDKFKTQAEDVEI